MTTTEVEAQLSRRQILDLIQVIGGHGADLSLVEDLMPVFINRVAGTTDVSLLNRALSLPQTYETRALLMARRGELEQIAKTPPRKDPPYTGLTVNVPPEYDGLTHVIAADGLPRPVREVDGQRVVDVGVAAFLGMISEPGNNGAWQRANLDVIARISKPKALPPMPQSPH
jgi:hypothetical protein